jgi:hypothetical protein
MLLDVVIPYTISLFGCYRSRTANPASIRLSQSKIVNLKSKIGITIYFFAQVYPNMPPTAEGAYGAWLF